MGYPNAGKALESVPQKQCVFPLSEVLRDTKEIRKFTGFIPTPYQTETVFGK